MAQPNRYRGVAKSGKIELEPGANLPDGAEVIVLFDGAHPNESKVDLDWLLKTMREGFDLGGGPYVNRTEQYGDSGQLQ